MTLFVHKKTVRYYDYGCLMNTVHGIAWSPDGEPQNATGFEHGGTVESARARLLALDPEGRQGFEIVEGPHVSRSCDMNPHGLM